MILYIEKPKETIRKLLELISECSKVVGYRVNTQKWRAFLYRNNEKSEREIKESIPFTIATKRIKYLRINLPKETKELYIKNYKILMNEIKDDINRWRDIPCSWVRISTLWKWLYYQIQFTNSMCFLSNYQWHFSQNLNKKVHNSYRNTKKAQIPKAVLRKRNGAGAINFSDFRLYYKATVIKTVWQWHKSRNM